MSDYHEGLLERIKDRFINCEDSHPYEEIKDIYDCLVCSSIIPSRFSCGCFALSAHRLYFLIDGNEGSGISRNNYVFFSTQIKDITTVTASYNKSINWSVFIFGLIVCFCSLFFVVTGEPKKIGFILLLLLSFIIGCGIIVLSFTFLIKKRYKIFIGNLSGGITIKGWNAFIFKKKIILNQPKTIIYNITRVEPYFYEFVENLNSRIAYLQEHGEYE